MSGAVEARQEVTFRANKRRKIFRKRHANDEDGARAGDGHQEDALAADPEQSSALVKRPRPKKHGIAFTGSGSLLGQTSTPSEETALVPVQKQPETDVQSERFVKPTGKASVVEDKHLTAYIDLKLAEARCSNRAPSLSPEEPAQSATTPTATDSWPPPSDGATAATQQQQPTHSTETTTTIKSSTIRPTRSTNPKRTRRGPPPKPASDLAREAMVDEILRESEIPMYDRKAAPKPIVDPEGLDNDEAAARAFKAEFLANLAQRTRRRAAAAPPGGKVEKTSSGPKLGGSRAQRGKMRALEQAKRAGGKPKK